MTILPRWWKRTIPAPGILRADNPKGPWGGGDGSGGNSGGPRNPWALPPGGKRGPAAKPTALDEFLRKARSGGGGGGGLPSGFPQLPGGANARTLWGVGLGALALLWILFTSIHQIGPQQRGVVSLLGRYVGTLQPGLQFTAPAPIARVQVVDVQRFRTENFPRGDGVNLTLTGDQNIVDLTYSVRWNVMEARDYVYQLANPEETVRAAAESAMRAVFATTTLDAALGAGRTDIEQGVAERTQAILDSYRSGVQIQGVSINRASAPQQIVDDFNKVTAAQQEAVAAVNGARGYAQQVVARARGEAAQFDRVFEQYRLAPEVTRRRMYYETMEAVLAKSDKTIVEPQGVVPYLNARGGQTPAEPVVQPQPQAGAAR